MNPTPEELQADAGIRQTEGRLVNLSDFPRLGTETNDTGSFQRALDALADAGIGEKKGGTLSIPEGGYAIDATLTYSGANGQLMIRGEGRDLTFIEQRGDAGFLSFGCLGRGDAGIDAGTDTLCEEGAANGRLLVRDLSLSCASGSLQCGTAIDARWPPMVWDIPVVDIEDVAIHGANGNSAWANGIVLENPSGSRITDVSIKGDYLHRDGGSQYPYLASDGIWMRGTNVHAQVSHYISTTNVSHYNTCYKMKGWLEGIAVSQFEAVECGDGVVFIGAGAAINLYLVNGHINVRKQGVYVDHVSNINLIGVDLYKDGALPPTLLDGGTPSNPDAGPLTWTRSDLATFVNGGWVSIDSSRFSTRQAAEPTWVPDTGMDTAIVLSNMYQGNVTDNGFTGFNRGVDLYGSQLILTQSNRFDRTNLPVALNASSKNCVVKDNMWMSTVTPAGDFILDNGLGHVTTPNYVWTP